jgi:co-chaperonin GroES (HSP10)
MIKVAQENKLLIKQIIQDAHLGNGLSISRETQNRKDIITGTVIDTKHEELMGKKVFFPLYASLPFAHEGENYLVVDLQDILVIDDSPNS